MQASYYSKYFLLVLYLSLFSVSKQFCQAQQMIPKEQRNFNGETLKKFRRQKAFQYKKKEIPINPSWWERFKQELINWLVGSTNTQQKQTYWKIFFYIIALITLLYIVIKISGIKISELFYHSVQQHAYGTHYASEDIHHTDFDSVIEKAIQAKNYGQAVRLFYLKTLKKLADKKLINWEKDKTNKEYIQELKATRVQSDFEQLTFLFEYICYGDFPVEPEEFEQSKQSFQHFYQALENN